MTALFGTTWKQLLWTSLCPGTGIQSALSSLACEAFKAELVSIGGAPLSDGVLEHPDIAMTTTRTVKASRLARLMTNLPFVPERATHVPH
jgi:hypothetical protein